MRSSRNGSGSGPLFPSVRAIEAIASGAAFALNSTDGGRKIAADAPWAILQAPPAWRPSAPLEDIRCGHVEAFGEVVCERGQSPRPQGLEHGRQEVRVQRFDGMLE